MSICWSVKNLLISSKSIKPESLDDILGDYLNKEVKKCRSG
ncbi:response regulator receiver protein [Enterobacter asburiae]|uniref:Response regulator receiver protein n=1 Tax=Enterobacter asburiae TaxID=61645 RepID=A0A376FN67_ENTAS|nr:response regulator receiver protein [Enterobacter asburiae]